MIVFNIVHRDLTKPNVPLMLLHYEYDIKCHANGKISSR